MSDSTPDGCFSRQIAQNVTNTTLTAIDRFHAARTVRNISADGSETVSVYTNGRLMSATRKDGGGAVVSAVTYQYDGLGRRSRVADGRGVVTAYGYDAAGRMAAVTNALGAAEQQATRYTAAHK
jgi:YD repeat-containing protein